MFRHSLCTSKNGKCDPATIGKWIYAQKFQQFHVIICSKEIIEKKTFDFTGLSYDACACSFNRGFDSRVMSIGIIQDRGIFDGITTAAHELGHLWVDITICLIMKVHFNKLAAQKEECFKKSWQESCIKSNPRLTLTVFPGHSPRVSLCKSVSKNVCKTFCKTVCKIFWRLYGWLFARLYSRFSKTLFKTLLSERLWNTLDMFDSFCITKY